MDALLCFGLGYVGRRLARAVLADGGRVVAVARHPAKLADLTAPGLDVVGFPPEGSLGAFKGVDAVLSTVPPGEDGDPVAGVLRRLLTDRLVKPAWIGYLSSTGVYGDTQGTWVDETAPPRPTSSRARLRLTAETGWRTLAADGFPVHVFRLAAIYGPGRSALDQVRAGGARLIAKPGHVFSRIHVDDIVSALLASTRRPNPGAIYNLADDRPSPQAEVIAEAFRLLGRQPPPAEPFERAALSEEARAFWNDCRRVANTRAKTELDWRPAYPGFREGLAAILDASPPGHPGS